MWSWWIVWVGLALAVVLPLAAGVRAGRAALSLWRDVRTSRGALFGELDRLADAADAAGTHAAAVGGDAERLTRSLGRLARSRRRLAVLQSAWDEVTDSAGGITALYPRKPQV